MPEPDPANRLRQRAVVGGEPPDAGALPDGCAFAPRCPLVIRGTCERVVPPLITLGDGHQVACHLYPTGAGDELGTGEADAALAVSITSSAASRKGSSDSG